MSAFFPHINLEALKRFAVSTAVIEHRTRNAMAGTTKSQSEVEPRIISCEDVYWGGDNMIMLTFDPESLPLGPRTMMAHFPQGRPRLKTQALVGMTSTIRAHPLRMVVPQIYAFIDYLPNEIGAEVVLLQKLAGESLDKVWPTLTYQQEHQIIHKVAEILLGLFNYRGNIMNTDLQGSPGTTGNQPLLLAPAFDQGPLATMPPQIALPSIEEYLRALANRIERVFSSPEANRAARDTGHSDNPLLTDQDVARIRETWKRLARLIPFHIGGFYLPNTLSKKAYGVARSVLQSQHFGIYHSDMQMARFIVDFNGPQVTLVATNDHSQTWTGPSIVLGLTGWEHAYRAPLWSCARMPIWLYPRITPNEVVPWERQRYIRMIILVIMNQDRAVRDSWQWVIAYVYGATERWFEGCLSSHWKFRDTIELLLTRLRMYWQHQRPDVVFPMPVGAEYAAIAPGGNTEGTAITDGKGKAKAKHRG